MLSYSIISRMTTWSKSKEDQWHLKEPIIYFTFGNISRSMTKSAFPFNSLCTDLYAQTYRMVQRENCQKQAFVNTSLEIDSATLFMKLSLPFFFDFVNPR